ncbi:MAG: hypothetical protein AAFV53_27370 [Myxococcota bacterium]
MTAAEILLGLLNALHPHPGAASLLVHCGKALGLSVNQVRVGLSRLTRSGRIRRNDDGYRLTARAASRWSLLGGWRDRLDRLVAWDGGWWVALSGHRPRSDRKAARRRRSALQRLGFETFRDGLDLRPANLDLDRQMLATILSDLHFDGDLLTVQDAPWGDDVLRALWAPDDRSGLYHQETQRLRDSLRTLPTDADAVAAAFFTGHRGQQVALHAPLIPTEWLAPGCRQDFWAALDDYDRAGRALWDAFFTGLHGDDAP